MSAFKQFTTKDVVITPFNANKGFSFIGTAMTASNVGIEVYSGVKPPTGFFISPSDLPTGLVHIQNEFYIYNSIKQLYYSNYLSSSLGDYGISQSIIPGVTRDDDRFVGPIEAPIYENYLQSTLIQSRYFPTGSDEYITVFSIPAKLYGENIVPYTFEFEYTNSLGDGFKVVDDGEGNLIINSTSSITDYNIGDIIGQVFYSHGLATITTGSLVGVGSEIYNNLSKLDNLSINFSSSIKLYEHQYKCVVNENEFLYSLNPSLLSGSLNDVYYDFATGSEFTPYVTTIGLYSENQELLAVGKLAFASPISKHIDTTFVINFDT